MKIAVLSGKGGTGKTFVSVNLACAAENSIYIDCDVEEPNGRLFLKPFDVTSDEVVTMIPEFDGEKCTGCRKCVDFCRFNALFYIKEKPAVITEVCHACGGCAIVCPEGAISEVARAVGNMETGTHGSVDVITGILNPGEASAIPVIQKVLETGFKKDKLTVIDCPPGSSCSAMESISQADFCLMVVEPTSFGFHNFMMIYELATLLEKKIAIVINKETQKYEPLEEFCRQHDVPVFLRIPYSKDLALSGSKGEIAVEKDENLKKQFVELLEKIGGAL